MRVGGHTDLYIIRNFSLTAHKCEEEILRPHVVFYTAPIDNSFFLCRIVIDLIQLVLSRTFLKLKHYSVWSSQHAILTSVQLNIFGTHMYDELLKYKGPVLLSKT